MNDNKYDESCKTVVDEETFRKIPHRRILGPIEAYIDPDTPMIDVDPPRSPLFIVNIDKLIQQKLKTHKFIDARPDRIPPAIDVDTVTDVDPTKEALNIGLLQPLLFATEPPYTSPGYNCFGLKQPVGVVKTSPCPSKLKTAVVGNNKTIEVPTWISPMYKTYGIGGPYGPHGPFKNDPLAEQNFRRQLLQKIEEERKMARIRDLPPCSKLNKLKNEMSKIEKKNVENENQ